MKYIKTLIAHIITIILTILALLLFLILAICNLHIGPIKVVSSKKFIKECYSDIFRLFNKWINYKNPLDNNGNKI